MVPDNPDIRKVTITSLFSDPAIVRGQPVPTPGQANRRTHDHEHQDIRLASRHGGQERSPSAACRSMPTHSRPRAIPSTGAMIGDDAVMVIDAQATPKMAEQVIERIRTVTDKPIKYVVLTHYHAVRVLGASGYNPEHIICSEATRAVIVERGAQDLQIRAPALPAPVPGGRDHSGPDLADHDLRRPHEPVARQGAGRHHPRPGADTPRAIRSCGCRRSVPCSAATWSSTVPRPTPATPT